VDRAVGGSGLAVSALSLGTATFGGGSDFYRAWGETGVAEATRLVDVALDAGVTMFDTADSYSSGLAEEILGKAIAGRRETMLISTKASFRTGPGPDDIGSSRRHLIPACEASLRRLGTDHIDLWSMHGFDSFTPIEETLRAIDDLVRAGKVRYVGCSNFSGWALMKSLAPADRHDWPRYIAHQAYYSLVAREYEWELMPLALDQQVGTVVWSPLSGGQLSGKVGRDQPAPQGSRVAALGMRPGLAREQFYDVVDAQSNRHRHRPHGSAGRSTGCCGIHRLDARHRCAQRSAASRQPGRDRLGALGRADAAARYGERTTAGVSVLASAHSLRRAESSARLTPAWRRLDTPSAIGSERRTIAWCLTDGGSVVHVAIENTDEKPP
jgi:aryl-alcohol dehydrogenase-like predicted oxidoreductase